MDKDTRNVKHRRESQRMQATRELSKTRTRDSMKVIVTRLKDPSRAVQDTARDALISIGGEDVVKELVPLLDEENTQLRNLAIEILGKIGMDAPQHLYSVIESGKDDAKIFALDILGVLENEASVDPMAKAFESDNVNVRNAAAMAMSRIGSEKAVPHLMKALEDDEWVRFSAIEGLASSGSPEVIDALVDKLAASRDKDYYSGILECFVQMKHVDTIAPLLEELTQVDPKHHGMIVESLVELISLKSAQDVVNGNLRDRLEKVLIDGLGAQDPWSVFRVLDIIRWLGERRYVNAVFSVLESGNELAQAGAARALDELATAEDLPKLETLVSKPDLAVKDELTQTLTRLKG